MHLCPDELMLIPVVGPIFWAIWHWIKKQFKKD